MCPSSHNISYLIAKLLLWHIFVLKYPHFHQICSCIKLVLAVVNADSLKLKAEFFIFFVKTWWWWGMGTKIVITLWNAIIASFLVHHNKSIVELGWDIAAKGYRGQSIILLFLLISISTIIQFKSGDYRYVTSEENTEESNYPIV